MNNKQNLLFGLFLSLCLVCFQVQAKPLPKVITVDWTIAETLIALDAPPIAIGDKKAYQRWVKEPKLSATTVDLGSRVQPSIELVKSLKPDIALNSTWWSLKLGSGFKENIQQESVDFYSNQGITWQQTVIATRQLGLIVGNPAKAEQLIQSIQQQLNQQKMQLSAFHRRPIAVVQFIDARHVRIYGQNSLFDVVLQRLGLNNAWHMQTNAWGFNNIDLTQLAKLPKQTLLVVVHPHPLHIDHQLQKSLLWQRLPFSQPQNTIVLPAVWSFGALPSMGRFANVLVAGLNHQQVTAW
ncbi:ABC transporter substrate-binding protein [Neisseria sp. Ec49-e6-T10]|uniref:ABC transporter substrate-binding protein n=1 Tax=Neisseria sp. Ec49-e6-T10 TaxID=3140744 RepID=UPI003EBEDDBB